MSIDTEHIVNEFINNFDLWRKHKIALYGIGKNTKSILDRVTEEYNIMGLLDAESVGSYLWGYKVLSEEELLEKEVDIIVIVARKSVHNIIYNRIEQFTKKNNIRVMDVSANVIFNEKAEKNRKCETISYQHVIEKIKEYDVVSFDLYDTIFQRNVLYPSDLLKIIGIEQKNNITFDFYQTRIWAEMECKKEKYPSIYEIYELIEKKERLDKDTTQKLLSYEVEKEENSIFLREEMVHILNWCVQNNKKIVIVSDMYLPSSVLNRFLKKFGINDIEKIYVSCDYGITKKEGLFRKLTEEQEGKIVHIGDNEDADIKPAKELGIDTIKILSAYDMLVNSNYAILLDYATNLSNRAMIAQFIKCVFSNPFALKENGKVEIRDVENFSKVFLAPLFYTYMVNLYKEVEINAYDEILFVSRDGFLPLKIWELISEKQKINIPSMYLYISGRAISVVNMTEDEQFPIILDEYKGSPKLFFEEFMTMTIPKVYLSEIENMKYEKVLDIAFKFKNLIFEKSIGEKNNYINYLKKNKLYEKEKILYCDIFTKGTGQYFLERLLGKTIRGFSLQKGPSGIEEKDNVDCISIFKPGSRYSSTLNIIKYYSIIEYFFSAPEPCFLQISDNLEPVFFPEDRKHEDVALINTVHNHVYRYCEDMINSNDFVFSDISIDMIDQLIGFLDEEYTELCISELDNLETYEWSRAAKKVVGKITKN